MSFDAAIWTFVISNVLLFATILMYLIRLDRKAQRYFVEHEMLMDYYCEHTHQVKDRLPTRVKVRP